MNIVRTHAGTTPKFGHSGKVNVLSAAIVVLLTAILVVGIILLTRGGSGTSSLEPLPAIAYRNAPENFLGNRYRLTGQVHSLLIWEKGTGRLVAVLPDNGDGRVAVFVPDTLEVSLHTGQRYHFDVDVRDGGLLFVENLDKY